MSDLFRQDGKGCFIRTLEEIVFSLAKSGFNNYGRRNFCHYSAYRTLPAYRIQARIRLQAQVCFLFPIKAHSQSVSPHTLLLSAWYLPVEI